MYNNQETAIAPSGLRYTSKENGSPFQGMGSSGEMLSCMQCGVHKPRSKGAIKRYLASPMFFCFVCRPKKVETQ